MKKIFVLISLLSLVATKSLAQNSNANTATNTTTATPTTNSDTSKVNDIGQPSNNSNSAASVTTNNTDSNNTKNPPKNITPNQKLDLISKPLDNSALVDNIQGGMANLLMGNKSISLMFDDHEMDNINRAVDSFKNNQSFSPDDDFSNTGYTPDDKKKRDEEAAAKAKQEQDEFNANSYIYLASIMYSTPHEWVVWINDKKITSDTNKKGKELFVSSVERDKVSILWNVSPSKLRVLLGSKADSLNLKTNSDGQIEVKFSLQPNQTFVLGSNVVVEGKAVTNMIKKKPSDNSSNTKSSQISSGTDDSLKGLNPHKTRALILNQ